MTTHNPSSLRNARCVLSILVAWAILGETGTGTARAGSLSGAYTVLASASTINLTAEGLIDWAHWGYANATSFNHKTNTVSQISNFTLVGAGTVLWFNDNFTGYTWTNGTRRRAHPQHHRHLHRREGNGFEVSVPADTTVKTFKIYVAPTLADAFRAVLSDGAPPLHRRVLQQSFGRTERIYTLNFAANSAGQSLTVRFWSLVTSGGTSRSRPRYSAKPRPSWS